MAGILFMAGIPLHSDQFWCIPSASYPAHTGDETAGA